jgi:cytochrome c oxidase subunit 2
VRKLISKRANRKPLAGLLSAALFAIIGLVSPAGAADVNTTGWASWWLPPVRSEHGGAIDTLFVWIFWITMIVWILVTIVMIVFLIKYRHRPERTKAKFTHGNSRLEMAWTIAPAIILAVLALASKKVWDEYRYSPSSDDPNRAQVLVVGQQFKWNSIYPGPDGKFGRYLLFPRPTDLAWPNPSGDSTKPYVFAGVSGPAMLPFNDAVKAINQYIDQVNPLGKDFTDPDGKDDDWKAALAREITLPKGRPVEVILSSKDVLHDFFLPNFRVKLDAVPGMRGHLYFTAMESSAEREAASRRTYTPDELLAALKQKSNSELTVSISEADKADGAEYDSRAKQYLYRDAKKQTIVRDKKIITPEVAQKLKDAGIKKVTAYLPGYWDLVCEELCGQGHYTMQGKIVVVDNEEYHKKFETGPAPKVAVTDSK